MSLACDGEEYPPVKPNWMGPSATMSVQRKAETWDSRRTAMEEVPAAKVEWREVSREAHDGFSWVAYERSP